MPTERAGYTVTMFLIDISPSMGSMREVQVPSTAEGQEITTEMTNLQWSLQFVKMKIQEMIYNGRKTDQCGVIIFGSEDTDNMINEKNGGYEHVTEYIPIAQPNASTLAKLDELEPSTVVGDPVDALIVGIETQNEYMIKKKTWTRKIVILTDGQNPIEVEDWDATVKKMNSLDITLTIIGVDFDDDELPYYEENKSDIKRANEEFFKTLTSSMKNGVVGNCALALREAARPDIKQTKSALMGTVLRLGDVENHPEEAIELSIKTSKCTALQRPKSWKKFGRREAANDPSAAEKGKAVFAQLRMRTEYYVDRSEERDDETEDVPVIVDADGDQVMKDEEAKDKEANLEKVEKEQLIRGFKYGATYVPCPDGQFPRLSTKRGMDICGFFHAKNFRRELSLGEIQYVWADPDQPQQQVALSSIVQAMYEKNVMAIARWVSKDGMDPKMGVLAPCVFEKVDCLLWAQMPFADDVRKYTFASLDNLVTKKGQVMTSHPYIPTEEQLSAMDDFVDALDLMEAGEKDEEGNRGPWFDTRLSYNPAIHRTKQAQFHCAIVSDISTNPLPPPHPELLKFFDPPKKLLKRAKSAIDECQKAFKIKEVPKKVTRQRKDGHVHAQGDDDEMLLLDRMPPKRTESQMIPEVASSSKVAKSAPANDSDTEEDEDDLLLEAKPAPPQPADDRHRALPTPARSVSPANIHPQRAKGRIIGNTFPLADFRKNIAQGDVVSKAVEDLAAVITEIVLRPFSSRRTDELLECMKAFRDVALKEDEIDAWNNFLTSLKQKCHADLGNTQFWPHVQKQGRGMSLISDAEAAKHGGKSAISERKAEKFLDS